jgi:hypothetical protein
MADRQSQPISWWKSPEFVLVAILVGALLLVIGMIFAFTRGTTAEVVASRKDLLAIILGAFGAWIGAGAAYFFGRENLRTATESTRFPQVSEAISRADRMMGYDAATAARMRLVTARLS